MWLLLPHGRISGNTALSSGAIPETEALRTFVMQQPGSGAPYKGAAENKYLYNN